MKTKNIFIAILALFFLTNFTETGERKGTDKLQRADDIINPIKIEWLTGTQPKLLSAMANTKAGRETLIGDSGLNLKTIIGGWHAQAVGQYKDFIYVGFSDGKLWSDKIPMKEKNPSNYAGKLWVYNTKTKESKLVDLEKGYPHPCSIQVTGKYLTIAIEAEYGLSQAALGTERVKRSMALIFDLEKDPNCSVEVGRVVQPTMNSGGAGLTYSPAKKCWYMLMDQDYEKGKVALYKTSNQQLNTWGKTPIAYYPRFGSGAGLNLITATDNTIWGMWYDSSHENLPNYRKAEMAGDEVTLFKLIEKDGIPVAKREIYSQMVNIESPRIESAGELLAARPGMRFGASFRNEGGKIEVLTCQRNMDDEFNINRTIISEGSRTQVMFVNLSASQGEIYCSSLKDNSQNYKIKKLPSEWWNESLTSPVKGDVNYLPATTSSAKSLFSGGFSKASVPKWTDGVNLETKAPLVLFYLEGEDAVTGKAIEFKANKKADSKLN